MPYTHKKVGNEYVVYKHGKKVGSTKGTKVALDKYLAALHIADKKTSKKESVRESITMQQMPQQMEPQVQSYEHPGCEDTVGDIFVVMKPTPDDSPVDIMHPTHAFGMHQFDPTQVHGVYNDEEEANMVAEATCNELYKHMKEIEDKKHTVTEKIQHMISKMQREVNKHMKSGKEREAQMMLEKISNLRNKHKSVQASKQEIKPLEEKQKK